MQIVALFNLETAALEHFSFSPHTAYEGGMSDVELMEHLQAGDVLLGAACTVPTCILPPWRAGAWMC